MQNRYRGTCVASILSLLSAGAALAEDAPTGGDWEGQQGTHIAVASGAWKTIRVTAERGTEVRLMDGRLIEPGRGRQLKEMRMPARLFDGRNNPTDAQLRLDGERLHGNLFNPSAPQRSWEYKVMFTPPGGAPQPLCDGPPGTDGNWALLVPGAWTIAGGQLQYDRAPGVFSFACVPQRAPKAPQPLVGGSVVAKCVDWGNDPATMPEQFQACVFLATADYCGHGTSNTIEGTWVSVRPAPLDDLPLKGAAPKDERFWFEAVWTYPRGDGRPGGVLCLSKKRWSTLPFDFSEKICPTLKDPRTGRARYCEQFTPEELQAAPLSAQFVSYSPYSDVGLYRCKNSEGAAWLTTTEMDLGGTAVMPYTPTIPGASSYKCSEFEGTILAPNVDLTLVPTGQARLIALVRHAGTKYVTDTQLPGPGETGAAIIGYILSPSTDDGALDRKNFVGLRRGPALKLYRNAAGDSFTTASDKPPAGFGDPFTLGYLIQLR